MKNWYRMASARSDVFLIRVRRIDGDSKYRYNAK